MTTGRINQVTFFGNRAHSALCSSLWTSQETNVTRRDRNHSLRGAMECLPRSLLVSAVNSESLQQISRSLVTSPQLSIAKHITFSEKMRGFANRSPIVQTVGSIATQIHKEPALIFHASAMSSISMFSHRVLTQTILTSVHPRRTRPKLNSISEGTEKVSASQRSNTQGHW